MAGIARADIALRGMARVAIGMGRNPGRDRPARAGRGVTRRAAFGRAGGAAQMSGMIEPHVETLVKPGRKSFHPRRKAFDIAMADKAHGRAGTRHLAAMAGIAGIMVRKF